MRMRCAIALTTLALIMAAGVSAQQPASKTAAASPPAELLNALSGIWNRIDPSGSGSYDAIYFPEPELRPEYAAKLPKDDYDGFGPPPPGWKPPAYDIATQNTGPARCAVGGGGLGLGGGPDVSSSGMALMASTDLVLMLRDGAQGARHLYVDGRPFPERFTGLYSIGRWQDDSLVVTTRGFTPGVIGQDRNRGRGYREASTVLTETMKPSPDGKRLTITYTYDDPKIYVKPWTYELTFERLPIDQYVFESWCDSRLWIEANQKAGAAAK